MFVCLIFFVCVHYLGLISLFFSHILPLCWFCPSKLLEAATFSIVRIIKVSLNSYPGKNESCHRPWMFCMRKSWWEMEKSAGEKTQNHCGCWLFPLDWLSWDPIVEVNVFIFKSIQIQSTHVVHVNKPCTLLWVHITVSHMSQKLSKVLILTELAIKAAMFHVLFCQAVQNYHLFDFFLISKVLVSHKSTIILIPVMSVSHCSYQVILLSVCLSLTIWARARERSTSNSLLHLNHFPSPSTEPPSGCSGSTSNESF